MSVSKKSTAKKTSAPKVAEPAISPAELKKNLQTKLKNYASTWAGFNQCKAWESKSGIKFDEWKAKINTLAEIVFDKLIVLPEDYFKKQDKPHPIKWQDGDFHTFLDEAARRIYTKDYVPIAKPAFTYETDKYYVYIIAFSGYMDWGKDKYEEAMRKIGGMSPAERAENEGKFCKTITENGKTIIVPLKPWEDNKNGKERSLLAMHSYMGTAIAVAIPIKTYDAIVKEEAQKKDELKRDLKDDERSKLWEELKPAVIDCGGDNFGNPDPKNPLYLNIKNNTYYEMTLSLQRGKKTKDAAGKEFYSFEGTRSVTIEKNADGTTTEITKYSGPRSFQYNFKLVEQLDKEKKPLVSVLTDTKKFDLSPEDLIGQAYDGWILPNGLVDVPAHFNKFKFKNQEKKERIDCLAPVAFTADVLEGKITKPDNENKLEHAKLSVRLDDRLDGKNVKDGDKEFAELTLYGLNNLSPEEVKEFEKCVVPQSRVKVIATLSKSSATSSIGGQLFYIESINSPSEDSGDSVDTDLWNTDDAPEQNIAINVEPTTTSEFESPTEAPAESPAVESTEVAEVAESEEEVDDSLTNFEEAPPK